MHGLFPPSTGTIFTGLAQIGLIFLMFQIGLEFEFKRHLDGNSRPIVVISLIGLAVPFAMGYLSAPWFHASDPRSWDRGRTSSSPRPWAIRPGASPQCSKAPRRFGAALSISRGSQGKTSIRPSRLDRKLSARDRYASEHRIALVGSGLHAGELGHQEGDVITAYE
jgi:hypothetical protein